MKPFFFLRSCDSLFFSILMALLAARFDVKLISPFILPAPLPSVILLPPILLLSPILLPAVPPSTLPTPQTLLFLSLSPAVSPSPPFPRRRDHPPSAAPEVSPLPPAPRPSLVRPAVPPTPARPVLAVRTLWNAERQRADDTTAPPVSSVENSGDGETGGDSGYCGGAVAPADPLGGPVRSFLLQSVNL